MAKKPYTPNTQEFYSDVMSRLNQALAVLTGTAPSIHNTPGVYVGLAASKAVTVNVYAKDMLNDTRRAALESLDKLAREYDAAVFTQSDMPGEDDWSGQAAHSILVEQTKNTDIPAVRQQLIDGIRAWMNNF